MLERKDDEGAGAADASGAAAAGAKWTRWTRSVSVVRTRCDSEEPVAETFWTRLRSQLR